MDIKKYLDHELGRLPITSLEYTRLHERALSALVGYIGFCESSLPSLTKEEYRLEAALKTGLADFPEVKLTGMLDRLDFDETGKLLRVIDYKSGKPKTRGYIEGTTKDSTGDYKRQLTFYALLLSLQDDERLHTRNGVLSFIEADERGKIHEEPYTITDEEIEALKKEIIRVTGEITNGAFLNAPCDKEKSDYYYLVEELRSRIV
jgi:RecB family exonuclease